MREMAERRTGLSEGWGRASSWPEEDALSDCGVSTVHSVGAVLSVSGDSYRPSSWATFLRSDCGVRAPKMPWPGTLPREFVLREEGSPEAWVRIPLEN